MGDGPMGGGPMGDAGPCSRCRQLDEDSLARERLDQAPFPSAGDQNSDILSEVSPFSDGTPVVDGDILGGINSNGAQVIDPAIPNQATGGSASTEVISSESTSRDNLPHNVNTDRFLATTPIHQ